MSASFSSNEKKYQMLLQQILPRVGEDLNKIILLEVMLALKQEGLIGQDITGADMKLINLVKDTILHSPSELKKALEVANRIPQ